MCKVGIEGFRYAFEYAMQNQGRCIVLENNAIDYASQPVMDYNNTLCNFAAICAKTSVSFLSCVKNTFCSYASEPVKATGRMVYQANKEAMYDSIITALPWIAGAVVVSVAGQKLLERYGCQNRVMNATLEGVGAVSILLLAGSVLKYQST